MPWQHLQVTGLNSGAKLYKKEIVGIAVFS